MIHVFGLTTTVAAEEVTLEQPPLTRTVYNPDSATVAIASVYNADVAPVIGVPFNCHWYEIGAVPDPVTDKLNKVLSQILAFTGCDEIVVNGFTDNCALFEVTDPHIAETTTEYCPGLLSKFNAGIVYVAAVAPVIGEPSLRH